MQNCYCACDHFVDTGTEGLCLLFFNQKNPNKITFLQAIPNLSSFRLNKIKFLEVLQKPQPKQREMLPNTVMYILVYGLSIA